MKVVDVGSHGQLGSELARQLGSSGVGLGREELDITDRAQVIRTLDGLHPTAVINTAGYTAVDRAEDEPGKCAAVNVGGVENLSVACRTLDCPLVQISTDYVFGSDAPRSNPSLETDPTAPQGVYARSKLHGEQFA